MTMSKKEKGCELRELKEYLEMQCKILGSTDDKLNEFYKMCFSEKCESFDRPDIYIKDEKENKIILIEHFEFNSYKANRKGSSGTKEWAEFEGKVNKNREEHKGEQCIITARCPDPQKIKNKNKEKYIEGSYKHYINNLKDNFNNHYNKIDAYKENLISKGIADNDTKFEVIFFIVDTSIHFVMYVNKTFNNYRLSFDKHFLDILKKCEKVDGCLVACKSHGGVITHQ